MIPDELPCISREFDNVQTGVGAIHGVNESTIVRIEIVGLNRRLASLHAVGGHAAHVSLIGDGRNVKGNLLRCPRIAYIDGANAGVEIGKP